MATRKTRTTRKAVRRCKKTSRPWTREESAFMRTWYRRHETSWVARQLGRTVYSVRYKAVDLKIRKANPSVWKGQKGPANAFNKKGRVATRRTKPVSRKTAATRKTTRTRSWRATSKRRTVRKAKTRRTTRRRSR